MALAYKQTPQQVLIVRRRSRRLLRVGPTGRWVLAALLAAALYRSIPATPDVELRTTVRQYLQFEYTDRRAPEMQARAAERSNDALLAVADEVLNSRIDVESMVVRGPILPAPLPRNAVVHVRYRVLKGDQTLETRDRYLAFGRGITTGWRFAGEREKLLYWTIPS
jgi:hypothetical protein